MSTHVLLKQQFHIREAEHGWKYVRKKHNTSIYTVSYGKMGMAFVC